jgi:hypothetical protein
MRAEGAPAGFVRVAVGDRVAVVLEAHAEDASRMLAAGSLYEAAARDPAARPLQGRGLAYAIALPATGTHAVVRHNRHGGMLAPFTRDLFLPPTRAPRELEIAQRLHALGVPTPEVLMYGTSSAPFPFRRADVVTREIEGGRDLSTYMARDVTQAERTDAWAATCALVKRMNDAGVRHHDLNVKNVLLAPGGAALDAYLLDVDRVTFGTPGSLGVVAGNAARLRRSARKWRAERGGEFDEDYLTPLDALVAR